MDKFFKNKTRFIKYKNNYTSRSSINCHILVGFGFGWWSGFELEMVFCQLFLRYVCVIFEKRKGVRTPALSVKC